MSDLFKLVSEKQLEGTGIQIAEKVNPLLGAIGIASAVAGHQMIKEPNTDLINNVQNIQIQQEKRIGKIVKAEQLKGEYGIAFIDEQGNKLVKRGGDISVLANNPGNICKPRKGFGPNNKAYLKSLGAVGFFYGKNHVYAIFPDAKTGEYALRNWLNDSSREEWTIEKAMNRFAPKKYNDTENYIRFLEKHGLPRTKTLKELNRSQKETMAKAIVKMEGGSPVKSIEFVPAQPKLASNVQKVSIKESKNINTKKAPLYIAKSIDDICLTMKQHKLNSVKVSYDSSIDTYIFGDTYNFVHWSLISTAIKNGLYADPNMDDLAGNIEVLDYTNKLDNFAISTNSNSKDLIDDSLEVKSQFESYGNTYYIYRNDIEEKIKKLNEGVIPTYEEDGTRYFYGYYCFTESELLNMLDTKFSRNDVRVAYEFNKHVYMFSDTITTIHYNIVFLAATETNLFDSIPEIKENKNADEDTVQELIKQYLYIAPFKIYRNDSQDSDEMFLRFLFNTVDNTSDYYDMACKINDTKWAVCRSDEFGDVKNVPLLQGKNWITADEYFTKYQNDDEELNESQEEVKKIIAYHGSQQDNLHFVKGSPFYLTTDYSMAVDFAKGYNFGYDLYEDEIPTVYTCEIKLNKVYTVSSEEEYEKYFTDSNFNLSEWKQKGYNAIFINSSEPNYYIMLNPEKDVKILKKEVINNINESVEEDDNKTWIDIEDIVSEYNVYDVLSLFQEENPWNPLIDAGQYKKALEEFVKTGKLLRTPTSLIENWFEIIVRNTRILTITTELSGHTQWFPFEEVKDYYFGDDELSYQEFLLDNKVEKDVSDFEIGSLILHKNGAYDRMILPDGSDAISDYGLKPLYDIIYEYKEGMTAEEVLVLINKALDVIHCRGDLASAFITGGRDTLTSISNESKKETKKPLYESKQLNKKVIAYHGSQNDKLEFVTDHNFYLTNNYDLAYEFATKDGDGGLIEGEVATIYTCELNIKKAYETHSEEEYDSMFLDVNINRAHWLSKGYNAIIVHPTEGSPTTYYIMLNPQDDVKIIKKEVIGGSTDSVLLTESYLKSLLLERSVTNYKTKPAKMANAISKRLEEKYKFESTLESVGRNPRNKSEISSFYVKVTLKNEYKGVKYNCSLIYRSSDHIKEKDRDDIDIFVPNETIFKNKLYSDDFTYKTDDDSVTKYINQGVFDIKTKLNKEKEKCEKAIDLVEEDYVNNYRNLSYNERKEKYDDIRYKAWFEYYIGQKELKYKLAELEAEKKRKEEFEKTRDQSKILHLNSFNKNK